MSDVTSLLYNQSQRRCLAFGIAALFVVAAFCSVLPLSLAQEAEIISADEPALVNTKLLREGSLIHKVRVKCRAVGDNLFLEIREQNRTVAALQNLASQRILKSVVEDSADTAWMVSGVVTEFNQRNYLLIKHAQRTSAK